MNAQKCKFHSFLFAIWFLVTIFYLPSAALAADVTLSWTQPDDTRVAGYNIYYGESGTDFQSGPDQSIEPATQTSCSISGLTEGKTYNFAATSVDADGNESDFSETIAYEVPSSATDPNEIDPDLTDDDGDGFSENDGDCNDSDPSIFPGATEICGDGIDQDCDGSDLLCTQLQGVTLSWTQPDDTRVTGYNIYCGETGTDFKSIPYVSISPAETTSYTFYDLQNGVEYSFAATSVDANGNESDFSETITYVVGSTGGTDTGSETLVFGDTPDADCPGTIQDSFINLNENVNISNTQLNTYTWPENMPANAILLHFDLSQLPAGAQIQSAALSLYQSQAGGDAAYDVSVHKLINYNPNLTLANGYTYDGTNAWTANSTCYNSIPMAQADIAPAADTNSLDQSLGYKQWDVTAVIQDWADNPDSNYGLLLNSDSLASSDSHRYFASSETTDAAQRPQLEVTYTIDENNIDQDGDGYSVNDGDLNDSDASIYPGAEEICGDGIDQDCDGSDLICPENIDNDGDGFTENEGDCNDNDVTVFPGAVEICGDGIDQDCDGSDLACISNETPGFELEINEIQVNHEWQSVSFNKTFETPVVVAKPMSLNGGQPAVVRIRNVTTEGFEIRIQEWEYLDGWHADEAISYMVMEAGHHELSTGIHVEAGTFETSSTKTISFNQEFNQIPVVLSGVLTENDLYTVTGRLYNINKLGFDFSLQEQEAHKNDHKTMETMSYIAWEPSAGTVNGMDYIVDSTFNDVTHKFYPIPFYPSFANSPVFVADMQTRDGADTANIRWKNKNAEGIEVQIDEEQSQNPETNHTTEVVGYMAFDPASIP